ncbi:hypothetical protein YC2023_080867 [Brassica napus]
MLQTRFFIFFPPPGHSDLLLLATVSTRLTLIRQRTHQLERLHSKTDSDVWITSSNIRAFII